MGMAAVLLNVYSAAELFAFISTFVERTLSGWAGSKEEGTSVRDCGSGAWGKDPGFMDDRQ